MRLADLYSKEALDAMLVVKHVSRYKLARLEAVADAARALRAGAVMQSLTPDYAVGIALMFTLSDALYSLYKETQQDEVET